MRLSRKKAKVSHLPRNQPVLRISPVNSSRRCGSRQNFQATVTGAEGSILGLQAPQLGAFFMGSPSQPRRSMARTTKPAIKPMAMVAIVLAMVKPRPMPAAVSTNISGSMMGDAIQNAMTGARGTPATSMAAISGITPQEQNGDRAPTRAAATTALTGLPEKALAMSWSDPVALA